MATASLENTRAKLAWADHHLDFFQELWARYFDEDPYEITAERAADRWVILRLHVRRSPPVELGLIFGDWLYSLRSALDNMIAPLIELNGKQPGRRRSFPVFDSERSFERAGRNRIAGVSDDHAARIEVLQPYPGRSDPIIEALALVDDLGNLDKHRAIHPVLAGGYTAASISGMVRGVPQGVEVTGTYTGYGKRLGDGAEFARLRFEPDRPMPQIEVESKLPIGAALSDRGLRGTALPEIRAHICAIVDRFAPDFPEAAD